MKYCREQLREMANVALAARANHDERYFQLLLTLSLRMMMPIDECEREIARLAT